MGLWASGSSELHAGTSVFSAVTKLLDECKNEYKQVGITRGN